MCCCLSLVSLCCALSCFVILYFFIYLICCYCSRLLSHTHTIGRLRSCSCFRLGCNSQLIFIAIFLFAENFIRSIHLFLLRETRIHSRVHSHTRTHACHSHQYDYDDGQQRDNTFFRGRFSFALTIFSYATAIVRRPASMQNLQVSTFILFFLNYFSFV